MATAKKPAAKPAAKEKGPTAVAYDFMSKNVEKIKSGKLTRVDAVAAIIALGVGEGTAGASASAWCRKNGVEFVKTPKAPAKAKSPEASAKAKKDEAAKKAFFEQPVGGAAKPAAPAKPAKPAKPEAKAPAAAKALAGAKKPASPIKPPVTSL